jgi:MFS superfamily sulfate permease-like transporter
VYLSFFLFGCAAGMVPDLLEAVERNRFLALALGLLALAALGVWARWAIAVGASWATVAISTFISRYVPLVRDVLGIRPGRLPNAEVSKGLEQGDQGFHSAHGPLFLGVI